MISRDTLPCLKFLTLSSAVIMHTDMMPGENSAPRCSGIVECEVLTAVTMKIIMFWVVTPRNSERSSC
jgi:hypothetical protein